MAATKQQLRHLAREFSTLMPKEDGPGRTLWLHMVFAVANSVAPTNLCNEFEWACSHCGIWPDNGQLNSQELR